MKRVPTNKTSELKTISPGVAGESLGGAGLAAVESAVSSVGVGDGAAVGLGTTEGEGLGLGLVAGTRVVGVGAGAGSGLGVTEGDELEVGVGVGVGATGDPETWFEATESPTLFTALRYKV